MKKFLLSVSLAFASFVVTAQNHTVQSFLNVRSVLSTNVHNISNLTAGVTYNATWTNLIGIVFTNNAGTRLATTNGLGTTGPSFSTGAAGQGFNLLRDCSLWTDRNGQPVAGTFNALLSTNSSSGVSIYVRGVAGAGTAGTVTFTFRPVYDGTNMETGNTKDFTFAYPATASSVVAIATNVPTYLWPGAKSIRLLSIVNGSANANAEVNLLDVKLVGFVP